MQLNLPLLTLQHSQVNQNTAGLIVATKSTSQSKLRVNNMLIRCLKNSSQRPVTNRHDQKAMS